MRWAADEDGHTSDIDREWTALTGQSLADAGQGGWLDVVFPDDAAYLRCFLKSAYAAQSDFELRYRVRARSGQYVWVRDVARRGVNGLEGTVTVLTPASGGPLHAYGVIGPASKLVVIADHLLRARQMTAELGDADMLIVLDAALISVGYRLAHPS